MLARRIARVLLWIFAAAGWLLFANLAVRVKDTVLAPQEVPVQVVKAFTEARFSVLAGKQGWSILDQYISGQAAEAIHAQAAANPGTLPELTGSVNAAHLIWAEGGQAMVEIEYNTNRGGQVNEIAYLHFADGIWTIERFWRVTPDPGGPLVPSS